MALLLALYAIAISGRTGTPGRWGAAAFAALAAVLVVATFDPGLEGAIVAKVVIGLLLAFPYFLLRFAASFGTGAARWREFLFFNRSTIGKPAARAFVNRLKERTVDRDAPIKVKAFQTQLKAIKKWGRGTPDDLSKIPQPTLVVNGDNDRMVPSTLSEDLHRRIEGSELIIYPDSGHGGIFQFHDKFAPIAVEFLAR